MYLRITSILLGFIFVFGLIAQETAPKLRPIQKNGKWGYIDKTGKIVIEPQFYWVEEFSEGLAAFETEDGKHGYIDETGKIVIEAKLDRAEPFSEGLAPVAVNFEWGFMDKTGKIVIPLQYAHAFNFSGGIAPVNLFPPDGKPWTPGKEITAYIDKSGKVLFDSKEDFLNVRASEGFALLQLNDTSKSYLVDKNGNRLIETDNIDLDGFGNDLIAIEKGEKWGYADKTGKIIIEPRFEDARRFSEGLAAVQINKKWGFINPLGKLVIPAKFNVDQNSEFSNFSEGLALVYLNNQVFYINPKGTKVIGVPTDDAVKFIGGIASVIFRKGNEEKRGYIDKKGNFVWKPTKFQYLDLQAKIEKNSKNEENEENEKLTLLTDEEKNLNYRDLIANQPDFSADLSFFRSEAVSGGGGGERITRKGNRYRRESQFWIFLGETGKPRVRLFPEEKMYDDLEPAEDETLSYSTPFNPKTLANETNITFTPLGKITIDGHECIKVQVQRKGENREKEKISLYLAKDLKYLVIVAQVQNLPYSFGQKLTDISLDVADSSVQIPSDYKSIERDIWKKVENVKIKYQGKYSKDFGVFSSPTGELFVWVNDAKYPWHYLIRPIQLTAETAYQGMLVTRNGKLIWETKEKEALSDTSYRKIVPTKESKSDTTKIIRQKKLIRFQSNDSKDIWIEIIYP
ncbi:MAG TPA: WG repeat-containing protein [Pyrinomonadaceae bacterium]|nr:WG repeat-containing protein [Pyrinomonadaceae bacterium]